MSVLPACANCGTALNGPFCSNCGQKASDTHRPFWWIAGEFLDAVFSYDSRTFRTIWLLFAEPGEFTRRYNAGQRASLLPPFRLFVIATLVFFLTLQATGVAMVAFKTRTISLDQLPPEAAAALKEQNKRGAVMTITEENTTTVVTLDLFVPPHAIQHMSADEQKRQLGQIENAIKKESESTKGDEAEWARWVQAKAKRIGDGYERALADPLKLNGPLNVWLPRLMLVLVPIFAVLLAVMHWRPKVYLYEHLIFSIHIHTVVFVALALVALSAAISGDAGYLWAIWLILAIYLWMAMYRVYGRSWWLTSLKFTAVMMVYSIILFAGLGSVFLIALSEV